MTTFTEGPRTAEFLISEGNGHFSRDVGTLGGDYKPGTVLGKVTAGGALKIYDPTAEDGTEDVFAILFEGGVSGDERTIISRVAEVKASKLVWFAGATANQIATGVAALEALGIVVR